MDILDKIAVNKRLEIEEMKLTLPLESFIDKIPSEASFLFSKVLSDKNRINIIAEIKKGSPSKGIISQDFNPGELAKQYKDGNAAALSVLTERKFFYGSFEYLKIAKEISGLPVLCKDFILDPYQVYHARYMGTDAILLIVKMLTRKTISELLALAKKVGLDVLVEVHNKDELEIALETEAEIIGVNNRNLNDFSVDLQTSVELGKLIPNDTIKVAESGIIGYSDIEKLKKSGYNNFLIGEALMKAENPIKMLEELQGR